ncbi:MAG: uL13 family ribosomal protein, partial [Bacteroidota bacterium]
AAITALAFARAERREKLREKEKKPDFVFEHAVKGMLPHNRLGRRMIKKLKVYAVNEHPHAAQKPEPIQFDIE